MILINLLPHRAAKRKERLRLFVVMVGLSAAMGATLASSWMGWVLQQIARQESRNEYLTQGVTTLNRQIKDVATLKEEIDALKSRQKAVEDLQAGRNAPVLLLEELVRQVPEGIQLQSLKQTGAMVTVTGQAQSNERVSEFLRHLGQESKWLYAPELQEIQSGLIGGNARESRRVYNFSLRFKLRSSESATPSADTVLPGGPQAAKPKGAA